MVKSLGKLIIKMYSMGACAALGIRNQDTLSKDLESDPFLNSALQRFTCELYHKCGSFPAPLSIGLIKSRHYFSERNATDTKNEEEQMKEMKPATKYAGLGAAIAPDGWFLVCYWSYLSCWGSRQLELLCWGAYE